MSNIIVFGHSWITYYLIKILIEINLKPKLVVAMSPIEANKIAGYYDLQNYLKSNGIKCYNPETYSLKSDIDDEYFENLTFDFGLVFGWSRLIPAKIIKNAKKAVLGVHGGPFPPPRCRGRAVFNWAMIDGFKQFYLYIFKIESGIDNGEIYVIKKIQITKHDNIESLYDKHSVISCNMFIEVVKNWNYYKNNGIIQDDKKATYMPKRSPEDSGICWEDSTKKIFNFVRALSKPFPNAFTMYKEVKINIENTIPFNDIPLETRKPGNIACVFANRNFIVETGDGYLYINKYKVEEKIYLNKNQILKSFPAQKKIDNAINGIKYSQCYTKR